MGVEQRRMLCPRNRGGDGMLRINELKFPIVFTDADVERALSAQLRVKPAELSEIRILRKSLDSRKKEDIRWILTVAVRLKDEQSYLKRHKNALRLRWNAPVSSIDELIGALGAVKRSPLRPIVVGSGPAGLFAALTLAKAGQRPIVLERGGAIEARKEAVDRFFRTGELDTDCNVQFGEGGAGTFSDGKLNTGAGGEKSAVVLWEFVRHGAPAQIAYDAKPHVGTDLLCGVIGNIRQEIVALGGEFRFDTQMTDLLISEGRLTGIQTRNRDRGTETIACNRCVLAIGHSARDTFELLARKVRMERKAFSIGVRAEHLQDRIGYAQYGDSYPLLPAADYKLSCHLDSGRSVYTFCMCPGGVVVPAASEAEGVVTNGMSDHARSGRNANSAILVGLTPEDFASRDVLAGVEFQRHYERLAFRAGGGAFRAPCQRLEDFLKGGAGSLAGEVSPTYARGVTAADLREILPVWASDAIGEAMRVFDRKIRGFAHPDTLLTGLETRSSSPVRILRSQTGEASVGGVYPCGEGAGYAGGITSAAADGIACALKILTENS